MALGDQPGPSDDGDELDELDVVHEFLGRCAHDRRHGGLRPLAAYQAEFPGHESVIAREFAQLGVDRGEGEIAGARRRIGPYELRRELGRGGQAVVHLAFDPRLRREVALKVLSAVASRLDQQLRLQREAIVAARLDDPGICPVFETGRDGDHLWLAMQFVPGRTLAARLAESSVPLPWRQVVGWFVPLLGSLQRAHAAGIVHRDLKPANVMIAADERPVLLDFGLATDEGADAELALTRTGDRLGTPAYASPELLRGGGHGVAADLWAAAVALFECLTGRRPFAAPTLADLAQAILHDQPPPLRRLHGSVPRDLATVLAVALDKDPARRYRSAVDFAADLAAVAAGRPIAARPPSTWRRLLWWHRRHAVAATAMWSLLIGSGVVGAAALANAKLAATLDGKVREYDLLAGVVRHRRAVAAAEALHPATPATASALRAWLADEAVPLRSMRDEVAAALRALALRALTLSAAELAPWREHHPDAAELARCRQVVASDERAEAIRSGRLPFVEPALPPGLAALGARDLRLLVEQRVPGEVDERTVFGEEAEALAMARAVVRRLGDGDTSESPLVARVTLSWALLANGLDAAALHNVADMLATAPLRVREAVREHETTLQAAIARRAAEAAAVRARCDELAARLRQLPPPRFRDEATQFLHDALCVLQRDLEHFDAEVVPSIERRLRWAETLAAVSRQHPLARCSWDEARAAIAAADGVRASERYRGADVDLAADQVLGLVPIGKNPATGLFEFYDLRSAWDGHGDPAAIPIPAHAPDGTLPIDASSGIVFVLVPGGTFRMGESEELRGNGARDSIPEHDVTLAPFLLARHELTQAQWRRLWNGALPRATPSKYAAGMVRHGRELTADHPVEQVSFVECERLCREHGFVLPTEAQWEYACRAGSTGPFWCDAAALAKCANVADATARRHAQWPRFEAFDDGHVVHAPVGSFAANAFGLFDVHGNVEEWCRDGYALYTHPVQGDDGLRLADVGPFGRVVRGGTFHQAADAAHAASRSFATEATIVGSLGLRVARLLPRARMPGPRTPLNR